MEINNLLFFKKKERVITIKMLCLYDTLSHILVWVNEKKVSIDSRFVRIPKEDKVITVYEN